MNRDNFILKACWFFVFCFGGLSVCFFFLSLTSSNIATYFSSISSFISYIYIIIIYYITEGKK